MRRKELKTEVRRALSAVSAVKKSTRKTELIDIHDSSLLKHYAQT